MHVLVSHRAMLQTTSFSYSTPFSFGNLTIISNISCRGKIMSPVFGTHFSTILGTGPISYKILINLHTELNFQNVKCIKGTESDHRSQITK